MPWPATCCSIAARASATSSRRRRSSALVEAAARGVHGSAEVVWSLRQSRALVPHLHRRRGRADAAVAAACRTLGPADPQRRRRSAARRVLATAVRLMRILWLNAEPAAAARQGRQDPHLAPHAPPGAAPRDHVPDVRQRRRGRGAPAGDARGLLASWSTCRGRTPAKGSLRFYAGVAAHLFDPLPYAVAKYRSAAYRALARGAARARRLRRRRLRLPGAGGEPAADAAVPVGPVHAQRRGRDLAAPRRERHRAGVAGALYRQQWRRMLRFEGRTLARFDRVLAVSEADDRRSSGSTATSAAAHRRGRDRRRHELLHADARVVRAAEAPGLHRLDGLDAERGRDAVLLPRGAAAHPPGRARRDAVDRRPRADARR